MSYTFIISIIVILFISILVGNYIAIDNENLSKSKKIYYKMISIISVFVFLGSFVFFLFLVNSGNFGSGIKII